MENGQLSKISKSPNCKCVLEVIFLDRTWKNLVLVLTAMN